MHKQVLEQIKNNVGEAAGKLQEAVERAVIQFNNDLTAFDGVRIYEAWLIEKVIESLENARKTATMERASFGSIPGWLDYEIAPGVKMTAEQKEAAKVLFGEKGDPTPFIRHLTLLWRDSWIIGPLDTSIEVLKTASQKSYI